MKIMIDILHPAHVHFFRNFIKIMRDRGNEILVTSREKEMTNYLLKTYGIRNICISSIGKNKLELAKELFIRNLKFLRLAKKFKPDLLMGIHGPTIAPIGKILGVPSYVFYDTENADITNRYVYPLASKVITPDCYEKKISKNHITYKGYHELAYLHPNYFKPNPGVLKKANIEFDEKFVVVRFVSWGACHDIGLNGLTNENKIKLVNSFSKYCNVYITSEGELPYELDKYKLKIPPEDIHSFLSYAVMFYGEGATMASESAVLGTPAIYVNPSQLGYLRDQEGYGLVYNYTDSKRDQINSIKKGIQLLKNHNLKKESKRKQKRLLENKKDVTGFMITLIKDPKKEGGKKSKKLLSEKIDVTKFMVNFVEETTEGD